MKTHDEILSVIGLSVKVAFVVCCLCIAVKFLIKTLAKRPLSLSPELLLSFPANRCTCNPVRKRCSTADTPIQYSCIGLS